MKRNNIIILVVVVLLMLVLVFALIKINSNSTVVPSNYFAKISNGAGEIVHNTYLYLEYGDFRNATYIQTTEMTESWGSSNWIQKAYKKGKLNYAEEVLTKAKENGSLGYVIINEDIDEYKKGDIITPEELFKIIAIN